MERLSMSSGPAEGGNGGGAPLTCRGPVSLVSFLGGMGAWSACAGAGPDDGAGSAAPKGPRGSAASSTDCRTVDWASTFLAGAFLPPGGRLVVLEVVLVVVLGVDEDAGVEVAGGSSLAVATVQLVIPFSHCGTHMARRRLPCCQSRPWREHLPVASQHPCTFDTPAGSTHRPKDGRPCWIMQRLGVTRDSPTARDLCLSSAADWGCGDALVRWCGGAEVAGTTARLVLLPDRTTARDTAPTGHVLWAR